MKTEVTNKAFHPLKLFKKVKSVSVFEEDIEECNVIENPDKKLAAKIKSTKLPKEDLFLEDGIAKRVSDLGTEYLYRLGNGKHLIVEHEDFAELRRQSDVCYINHVFQVEHHFNEHFGLLFGNASIRLVPRNNEFVSTYGYDAPTAHIHDFGIKSSKTHFSLVGKYSWEDSITLWFDLDGNYVTTEYPYDLFAVEKKPITMEKIIAEVKKLIPEGTYMHGDGLTWFTDEFAVRLEFEEPDEEDDDDDDEDDDYYGEGDRIGFSLEIIKRNKNGTYGSKPAIERPEKLTPVKRQSIILAATQAASRFGF